MRRGQWLALGMLLGAMLLVLTWAAPARSQKAEDKDKKEGSLALKIARGAKMSEQEANRFLQALGPAISSELSAGKTVNLPGLGTFRVVRVPEHKDMTVGGRTGGTPFVVPGVNTVEFLADGGLKTAANSATAVPAEIVPPFQYIPLPGQTPGQKTGRTHAPSRRVP